MHFFFSPKDRAAFTHVQVKGVKHQETKETAKGRTVDSDSPELKHRFPDLWSNTDPGNKEGALRFFLLQQMDTTSAPHIWEGNTTQLARRKKCLQEKIQTDTQ